MMASCTDFAANSLVLLVRESVRIHQGCGRASGSPRSTEESTQLRGKQT